MNAWRDAQKGTGGKLLPVLVLLSDLSATRQLSGHSKLTHCIALSHNDLTALHYVKHSLTSPLHAPRLGVACTTAGLPLVSDRQWRLDSLSCTRLHGRHGASRAWGREGRLGDGRGGKGRIGLLQAVSHVEGLRGTHRS
jgi:hypothetical protein